ncbi:hypothetical protein Tco_1430606 [Tanacetum coccineum]
MGVDYAAGGSFRKLRPNETWATIEKLAQYEDDGWNDTFIPNEKSLNYKNPDIKQLLGIMERKVDTLMKDTISLVGRIEGVFRIATNEMYRPPLGPSRQEEFEHIVMNFILDQEERVNQLKEYMRVIVSDFMQLSSKVTRRLKEKIKKEGNKIRKTKKITKYPDKEDLGPLADHKFSETPTKKTFPNTLKSIPTNSLWIRYVRLNFSNLPRFQKSTFGFKPGKRTSQNIEARHDKGNSLETQPAPHNFPTVKDENHIKDKTPSHYAFTLTVRSSTLGITFRLGGERKEMSLLEFRSRVGLYTEQQSRDRATLSGLSRAEMVKANLMLLEFWPTIRDGGFIVGNTKVMSIRDPKVRLAYRCIETTISGRKESTHRVTKIDLYYLYCIYTNAVVCNIPCWLAKYLKSVGDKNLICRGMFVTRIAWSFRVLTGEMMNALSVKPPPHVFEKKSLIAMGVIMELHNRECCWPKTRETVVEEEDEGDNEGNKEAGGYAGHEGVGGSADIYRNMSQGDWQVHQTRWMDQQDEQWGRLNTWMG